MKKTLAVTLLSPFAFGVGYLPDRRIPAPASRPFTALARVSAHGGVGCGVLVGPDLLVTCAHCVASPDGTIYNDVDIELGLGFYPETRHAKPLEFFNVTHRKKSFEGGDDWAIVRLDRPVGCYYGWLESRVLGSKEWASAPIELLGYCDCPDEARKEFGHLDRPYLCAGTVSHVEANALRHDCSMWGGTSGAPIVTRDQNGKYFLVALNFAGVDVLGEQLKHGFRATYSRELANMAIPASSWQPQLNEVRPSPSSPVKSFWARNRSTQPIKVTARYRSIFQSPGEPPLITDEKEVGWQQRVAILEPKDGCIDSEVYLSVTDRRGNAIGPKPSLEVENKGKQIQFFKKTIGRSSEYTAFLP